MTLKKLTAAFLSGCLLLTGCGKTSDSSDSGTALPEIEAIPEITETVEVPDLTTTSSTTITTTSTNTKTTKTTKTTSTSSAAVTSLIYIQQTDDEYEYETESPQEDEQDGYDESQENQEEQQDYSPEPEQQVIIVPVVTTVSTARKTTTTTATTTTKPSTPEAVLKNMTLEQKVCQMFMVTPEALTGISPMTQVGQGTASAMKNYPVGGIIYFAQNLTSRQQITKMISDTQSFSKAACGVGVFTAIDEEGGIVARAAQKLGTATFYNMAYYGSSNDSGTAYNIGKSLGNDLRGLGFNIDFAPVADVNIDPANELGERIFSSDPNVVANMASNVAKGLQDAGVSATFKHFPGLGAENGNTHTNSFVVIDRSIDDLRNTEFIPFKAGIAAGVDLVMVGHQIVTGFGDDLPCDLSYRAVTEFLRNELGFKGIAVTDAQQMNTISTVYGSGEAAIMSIKAGIDIILMPSDLPAAVNAVCNAVRSGEISEERINESVLRILQLKKKLGLF